MYSSQRRSGLLLALTAAGLAGGIALAAPAAAATSVTVRMDGGVMVVTGTSGADNLRLEQVDRFGGDEPVATVTIMSLNGPLSTGAGCIASGGASARCVAGQVSASLAGSDDTFRFVGNRAVFIAGGLGRDDIGTSNGRDELSGGDGDDQLSAGNNVDRIRGGNGTDSCNGGETVSSC